MPGEEIVCSVCAGKNTEGNDYLGIPVCDDCIDKLKLKELSDSEKDDALAEVVDQKGDAILGSITALIRRSPVSLGWKVLSLAPFIGEQVEDGSRRTIMESAMVIFGSSIVRAGYDGPLDGMEEEKLISLYLILGQYLDLSIMGNVSQNQGLNPESYMDEIIMVYEHDSILFNMLREMDFGDDPERMTIVARAMKLYVK